MASAASRRWRSTRRSASLILSLGVVFARPAPGVTSLLNGTGPGSVLARRLLPAVIALPIVLGWLRFKGEEIGLFDAGGGVALLATGTMLIMGILIWRSAVSLDRTDLGRRRAERMLQELNDALESRVAERTGELGRTNEALLDQTRFLNQVIDTNPHLVFVKDWSGRFTLANKAVADVYGTTVDTPGREDRRRLQSERRGSRRVSGGRPRGDDEAAGEGDPGGAGDR